MEKKCKFEHLNPGAMFDHNGWTYVKVNSIYSTPEGFGNALCLDNMNVYVFPNNTEVSAIKGKITFGTFGAASYMLEIERN